MYFPGLRARPAAECERVAIPTRGPWRPWRFFYEVDDDLESHEEHLRLAYDLGKTFLATERA
jgi:hypothetical protein